MQKLRENSRLDHVSFTVPKGRIVGLIGENGAGKSTTINLILNEWKPDGGEIRIFGESNTGDRWKDAVGVVFDECNFPGILNAKRLNGFFPGYSQRGTERRTASISGAFKFRRKSPSGSFPKA